MALNPELQMHLCRVEQLGLRTSIKHCRTVASSP